MHGAVSCEHPYANPSAIVSCFSLGGKGIEIAVVMDVPSHFSGRRTFEAQCLSSRGWQSKEFVEKTRNEPFMAMGLCYIL